MVLATDGTTSHVGVKLLAITSDKLGMYLCGEAIGVFDLKFGPEVDVDKGDWVETSLSVCSQQYVKESLFPSVATPVNIKAVDLGIV